MFIAILMAALAIAGAASKASAGNAAASAQIDSLNKQRALQAEQISDQASVQIQQATEQGRRMRSLIDVAAGDAGVSTDSVSVEAALSNSLFQEDRNRALQLKAERLQQQGAQARAESLYNQLKPPPAWLQGLQIGAAGAQAYTAAGGKWGGDPGLTDGGLEKTSIPYQSVYLPKLPTIDIGSGP